MSGCKASTVFFLYGGAHRLPVLDDLKLVWLRLLDNTTLSCLPPMCFWDTFESASSLSARHSYLYEPSNSMWIQNDVTPLKSHAWAEVTRCRESGDSPTDETLTKRHWEHLPWFYHAPGSGQSIHIGRTLVMPYHPFNMSEQFLWAQAGAYDSVQFLDDQDGARKQNRLRRRHEIVMLRNPMDPPLLRCGRHPWLASTQCRGDAEPRRATAVCDSIDAFKARNQSCSQADQWATPQMWKWVCAPVFQDTRVQSLVRVEYGTPTCPFDNRHGGAKVFRPRQPMNASCVQLHEHLAHSSRASYDNRTSTRAFGFTGSDPHERLHDLPEL